MSDKSAEMALDKAHWAAVAARMRTLTQYPEWDEYTTQMGGLEANWLEKMVSGVKDEYEYARGFLQGMRTAVHLPQNIIRRTEQAQK